MQRLSERKIRILGVMAPPGVGKTTIELMFMVMEGLKNPDLSILMGSHSNSFLRGAYEEVGRMLDPKGEYLWKDIFLSVQVCKTNAQDMRIDLGKTKSGLRPLSFRPLDLVTRAKYALRIFW